MAKNDIPSTMRTWTYTSADGGLERHIQLHTSKPIPKPSNSQHLIQVLAVGLNPVDFKPAEAPIVGKFLVKKPATPGFDIAGRIITPAANSPLEPGQLVFGAASTNALAGGGLAEYIAAPAETISPIPANISPIDAAGVTIAAITAYTSLVTHVRAGSRVFLNGGSGGVGTYGIQIAKALGAHVTVSCSARNAELCRSLGADKVLDYNARPLLHQLRETAAASGPFDHVVDNVFSDPALYYQAHTYTTPSAKFMEVASGPTLGFLRFALGAQLLPGFLGGGRRKFVMVFADVKAENLERVGKWIEEGKVKPVTDTVFGMEDVVKAFERLKTGRAVGKVIVDVGGEAR